MGAVAQESLSRQHRAPPQAGWLFHCRVSRAALSSCLLGHRQKPNPSGIQPSAARLRPEPLEVLSHERPRAICLSPPVTFSPIVGTKKTNKRATLPPPPPQKKGEKEFSWRHFATFGGCSSVEFAGLITHCHCSPFATIYTVAEVHISCNALCLTSEWEMLWNVHRREDGHNGGRFQQRGRMWVMGVRCLFSPPDVREVGQFVRPVHDPMCPFGTMGPSLHPGVGVQVAPGTPLSLGCS